MNESTWIKLARIDPLLFGFYVFRQANGLFLLPSEHHRKWHDFFKANKRGVVLAPPGVGKSVQITQIRLLWELCRDPNKCFIIISRSEQIAKRNLQVIRDTIQNNARFKKVFPNISIDPKNNNSTQITLVNRNEGIADPSIIAIGIGTSLMGRRADGIIIDDCQDSSNCSKKMSDDLYEWLQTTPLSRLSTDGFCFVISNSWNNNDIAHKLINDGWSYWTTQFLLDEGLETERSVWPNKFSLDFIKELRKEKGERIFQRLYQNNVNIDIQSYFEDSWFEAAYINNFEKKFGDYIIGVDLASGTEDKHDYTSFSIVYVDKITKDRFLLDTIAGKWNVQQKVDKFKEILKIYPLSKFYIENTGFQGTFIEVVKKEIPNIRCEGHNTNSQTKLEYALERFHVELARAKWKIVKNNNNLSVVSELKTYQTGDHMPDRIASLLIALQHIDSLVDYQGPIQSFK